MGLGGPNPDRFCQQDHELWSVGHWKLEGARATIALPQAQHDELDLGVPGRLEGPPPRICKPSTPWAFQVDEIAHGGSVRSNRSRVNPQVGVAMGSARHPTASGAEVRVDPPTETAGAKPSDTRVKLAAMVATGFGTTGHGRGGQKFLDGTPLDPPPRCPDDLFADVQPGENPDADGPRQRRPGDADRDRNEGGHVGSGRRVAGELEQQLEVCDRRQPADR